MVWSDRPLDPAVAVGILILSRVIAVLLAAWLIGIGAWAFLDPASFAARIATFPPYNVHLLHDVGAFQIGLGAALLAALPDRRALAAAFAGNLVAAVVHVISHVEDANLGGHSYDVPMLSVIALIALAGLILTVARRSAPRSRPT